MFRFRQLFFAAFLTAAVALGQYAAVLHALGHATEELTHKPGTPAKLACDQCFACSQLASGAASTAITFEPPAPNVDVRSHDGVCHLGITRVVFLSRGPPVLS